MTAARHISTDVRSALLMLTGTALLLTPLALELSVAAIATGVVVGAVVTGLGIAGTASTGRGTIPFSAHAAYDQGIAAGLLFAAIAFGLAAEPAASALFAGVALVAATIGALTRYSARSTA